jgi:hypothetical protein
VLRGTRLDVEVLSLVGDEIGDAIACWWHLL